MYICLCNPFSDKDVRKSLEERGGQTSSVSEVYRSCSGGESPCCGKCLPTLKDMVREHNGRVAIQDMSKDLKKLPA